MGTNMFSLQNTFLITMLSAVRSASGIRVQANSRLPNPESIAPVTCVTVDDKQCDGFAPMSFT